MPVESATDRAAFVNPDEFGVSAVYRRKDTLAETDITGIFDNAYMPATVDGEDVVSTSSPAFLARTTDLPSPEMYDDMIVLTTVSLALSGLSSAFAGIWRIKRYEPDGTGMTVLWLQR